MRLRPTLAALAVLALASPLLPSAAAAPVEEGIGSASLTAVANLPHTNRSSANAPSEGTDIEFATIKGVKYAIAGSYDNGLQIVDITDPTMPKTAAVYDCGISQGDVQVFTRTVDGVVRTYAGYTWDDGYGTRSSKCLTDAKAFNGGKTVTEGVFLADLTDVGLPGTSLTALKSKVKTVGYVPFEKGSHNHTIDPTGKFLYNSNSDLITGVATNAIEIYDISVLDKPVKLPDFDLPPVPTGLGADSHDITFNADGTRAFSAALSQTVVMDTTDKAAPKMLGVIIDPTINVVHQSDPVTITDKTTGMERDFLVIEDEVAGATPTGQCPNGGVHVYDVTGPLENAPVKVGYWNIDEVRTTSDPLDLGCTAHVFDLHEKEGIMTIAYYNGGVRVVDISGLVGVALGENGVGMKQVGFRRFTNSNTWAAKTAEIAADGSFFLYGNDQARGLDVYKFDPTKVDASDATGTWMGAAEAAKVLGARGKLDLSGYRMKCLPLKTTVSPVQKALQKAHHA